MRYDKEGSPIPTLAKIAEHTQTYFGDIEHARQLTPQALIDEYNARSSIIQSDTQLNISVVPSRIELARRFAG
eukprot:3108781-Pyramimonas_sp.AAC.1